MLNYKMKKIKKNSNYKLKNSLSSHGSTPQTHMTSNKIGIIQDEKKRNKIMKLIYFKKNNNDMGESYASYLPQGIEYCC